MLAGIGLALALTGCSTVATRIQKNPQAYAALSPREKALVTQGQVREGMSKPAVYIAWGRPDSIVHGSSAGRPYEAWSYYWYEPGNFGPHGIWPRNAYYDGLFWNEPYARAFVYRYAVFAPEKVVAWASSLYP